MRIVGVDPGSRHLGWGVIVLSSCSRHMQHVASGTLHAAEGSMAGRLMQLADALDALLIRHRPDVAAVEALFHAKNSQSALKLGQARGAALVCLARAGLQVFEYTASQIKQSMTGRGHADKKQVQAMVQLLLGCSDAMGLDTSDALAAAICHAHRCDPRIVHRASGKPIPHSVPWDKCRL